MVVICTLGLLRTFNLRDGSADLVATTCTRNYTFRLVSRLCMHEAMQRLRCVHAHLVTLKKKVLFPIETCT